VTLVTLVTPVTLVTLVTLVALVTLQLQLSLPRSSLAVFDLSA
jgi:hypothetical protein